MATSKNKKFGYFVNPNKEYVINTPFTPLPWINYIGNDNLQGIISNTGGGYTFYKDASLMRLTRYRYNNSPMDMNGRYIYIKLNDKNIYSPTYKPCLKKLSQYKCHHGMGYTRISSLYKKIKTDITFFIPPFDNVELWDFKIQNLSQKKMTLHIYPYLEFCLWNALDDFTNFQRNFSTGEVYIKKDTIYHITEYRERRNHFSYFTSNQKPLSFETRRNEFIGDQTLLKPQMLQQKSLANGEAHGWSPCAVQQLKINLNPGQSKRIIFQLGYFENNPKDKFINKKLNTTRVQKLTKKYQNPKNVDKAFLDLKKHWIGLLANYQVKSRNKYIDTMVNIWNQYQNIITYKMSRSASFYESGIGRGMGFRDSNQDLLGFMHIDITKAKERIFDLASTQLSNGHAFHQYQPLTKSGNHTFGSNYNDDPLWLVMSTSAYLKETGDFKFLNKPTPYENDKTKSTPLYEHLSRALKFTITHKGPHGLPLIGRADWNDCLNLNTRNTTPGLVFSAAPSTDGKTAESILIGFLFIYAAKEFKQIAEYKKDTPKVRWIQNEIKKMETALEKNGWDGQWWLRAYDAQSKKVGSKNCKEGKIFIEPQGWAVIAGAGSRIRQQKALDSVEKHLTTEHGIVLNQPAYSGYDINIGEISTYPPGYKENAGVFCHSNPWIMIGDALLKNSQRALKNYLAICPAKREEISDIHRCEPYVYPQMIAGKDAPTFGEAKNSWLTGTASWNFIAISQYILGIKPQFNGLLIDPSLPEDFGDYKIKRNFRNTTYNIEIRFHNKTHAYYIENKKAFIGNYIKHINGKKERNIVLYIKY